MSALEKKLLQAMKLGKFDDAIHNQMTKAILEKDYETLRKIQQKVMNSDWLDRIVEAWRAGLLSGPPTHMVNFVSGGLKAGIIDPFEAVMAGFYDSLRMVPKNQRDRFVGEGKALMRGAMRELPNAITQFMGDIKDALKLKYESTRVVDETGKFENTGKIPGKTGEVIRIPFHLLNAADDFWKKVIEGQTVSRLGYRQGKRKGLGGKELEDFLTKFEGEYHANKLKAKADPKDPTLGDYALVAKQVEDAQLRGTYQEDLPEGMKHMQITFSKHPWLMFAVPFMKTPYNIAKATVFRTIPGLAASTYYAKKYPGNTRSVESGADRLAMASTGTILMAAVYWAMQQQDGLEITGSGPTDPKKLTLKLATGWQPHSIKVGDSYYDYSRLEPFSSLMGMAADAKELEDLKSTSERIEKGVALIQENLTSKTFLSGLESLITAWHDPGRYFGQFAKQFIGSAIPFSGLVGRTAQAFDPIMRQSDAFELTSSEQTGVPLPEAMVARLPGLSRTLPAQRTATGQERTRTGSPLERFANPFRRSTELHTPDARVLRELDRIGYSKSQPQREITLAGGKKIRLNDREYKMMQDSYQVAARRLFRAMRDPAWKNAPDNDDLAKSGEKTKQDIAEKIYRDAKKAARAKLYQTPEFRRRAARVQRGLESGEV
jgi:hypothetical protein